MLLSVIIPAYNSEETLGRAIESVLVQANDEVEVIIINDGSTDNTLKVANKYANIKNLRIFTTENHGLSSARNYGIAHSLGNYLAFLDSDDEFENGLIKIFFEKQDIEKNLDVFLFNHKKVFPNYEVSYPGLNIITNKSDYVLKAILTYGGLEMYACNKIWKKNLFNDVQFPVGVLYEDMNTVYRLLSMANQFIISDFEGLKYYSNPTGITQSVFTYKQMDLVTQNEVLFNSIISNYKNLSPEYSKLFFLNIIATANKLTLSKVVNKEIFREQLIELENNYHNYFYTNPLISTSKKIGWFLYKHFPEVYRFLYIMFLKIYSKN